MQLVLSMPNGEKRPIDFESAEKIFCGHFPIRDQPPDESELEVVFLEVKTGDAAALSPKQRQIRDLIQSKNVVWREFRI
jgi:hypothetical protein